jgi:hypothetical protein
MYVLKHGIKKDLERRWALPDRIFFGYGACAILAGAFLKEAPLDGFYAERFVPTESFSGNHIYVTNGIIAFDYHGYSGRERLLEHHRKGWASHSDGWQCAIEKADFDLLDTAELNRRRFWARTSTSTTPFFVPAGSCSVLIILKLPQERSGSRRLEPSAAIRTLKHLYMTSNGVLPGTRS